MKNKIIAIYLFLLILITSCSPYDKDYVNTFIWKHAKGDIVINDFIYFGDDFIVNDEMEIIFKDSCVGKIESIEKKYITIISCTKNQKGTYVLHDSADVWRKMNK